MKLLDDIRHHLATLNSGQQQREAAVLLREAAAALADTRWIPVSERRPEVGQEILLFFEGEMYVGRYVPWPEKWTDATHWMPLPEPPEQP